MERSVVKRYVFSSSGSVAQDMCPYQTTLEDDNEIITRSHFSNWYSSRGLCCSRVILAGCGGIGWWAAQALIASGIVSELDLYDTKVLKRFHQNRMNVPTRFLGENKAIALAAFLVENGTSCAITPHSALVDPDIIENMSGESSILIDTTDSAITHIALYKKCKEREMPYYRISYNGALHITIADGASSFCVGALPAGYGTMPTWGLSAAMAAMIGVHTIIRAQYVDSYGRIRIPETLLGSIVINHQLKAEDRSLKYE